MMHIVISMTLNECRSRRGLNNKKIEHSWAERFCRTTTTTTVSHCRKIFDVANINDSFCPNFNSKSFILV